MPESAVKPSPVEDDCLDRLARQNFERVQQPTMQVALDLRDPLKVLGRSGEGLGWHEFERRKQTLYTYAMEIKRYEDRRRTPPEPSISSARYNQLFKAFVEMLVSYFRKMEWHHAAEAYAKYLKIQPVNTDTVRIPFSKVKALMMAIPEVQDVFARWRAEAKRYACSQPFSNPQPKDLGTVEIPEHWPAYAQHVDVGLVLGHFRVSARVAPRGSQGPMRMAWQLYCEVTAKTARFDFTDPNTTLPVPRILPEDRGRAGRAALPRDKSELYRIAVSEVPAVIFWAAEAYTGGAQPYPVYSHEFSEIFICQCERVD